MRRIINATIATLAVVAISACGGDPVSVPDAVSVPDEITLPAGVTLPGGLTIPDSITIPAGVSIPSDLSIPQEALDQMIAQFEAAGMKIDKTCFADLLKDDSLRTLVAAGGTPSPEVIQKFISCVTP